MAADSDFHIENAPASLSALGPLPASGQAVVNDGRSIRPGALSLLPPLGAPVATSIDLDGAPGILKQE